MSMTIPTWLMFLFLGIASLGPHVSPWPRWWIAYYGALLVCWVLMSVTDMRRAARKERQAQRNLVRMLPQFRAVPETDAAERDADAVRPALAEERLIVVARDKVRSLRPHQERSVGAQGRRGNRGPSTC